VREILPEVTRAVVTYGLSPQADIRGSNVRQLGRTMAFDLHLPNEKEKHQVVLNLPGAHNVQNALGAIAVAWELGISIPNVLSALTEFKGVGRRFAEVGNYRWGDGQVMVVEDYGHHPSELRATLAAARGGWPERRLVAVFQPHRYSRTRDLFDDFAQVLSGADAVVMTDIYSAGEAPIDGIDSRALCQSIRARGRVEPVLIADVHDIIEELPAMLQANDLVLLLGAGNIGQLAQQIREHGLHRREAA
jgi:UDP-N-acetylmuramate--alanine ligase